MNKKQIFVTILISLIFFISQLKYFLMAAKNAPTYLFAACFIFCIILFAIALLIFLKYYPKTFNGLELFSALIMLSSMLFITLIANGIAISLRITVYMGYANILLGLICYFKTRNKVNLSFMIWGLSIIMWLYNLYNAIYLIQS